jgi:hypothetical protein
MPEIWQNGAESSKSERTMKTCPFCAEEIQDAAIVCKRCRRDLPVQEVTGAATAGRLTPCRDCGQPVSSDAAACPSCGAAVPSRKKSEDWVPCPKFGSGDTTRTGGGALGCASLVGASCCLWIPIFGWVLFPFFLLAAAFFWISALAHKTTAVMVFQCAACKKWFRVTKDEISVT